MEWILCRIWLNGSGQWWCKRGWKWNPLGRVEREIATRMHLMSYTEIGCAFLCSSMSSQQVSSVSAYSQWSQNVFLLWALSQRCSYAQRWLKVLMEAAGDHSLWQMLQVSATCPASVGLSSLLTVPLPSATNTYLCREQAANLHAAYDLKQCRPIFTVVFMSVVELAAINACGLFLL